MEEINKKPDLVVGAYIYNSKGDIFLIKSPKWSDKFIVCGGHIEYGEKIEDALLREVKEETGLDVVEPEFMKAMDLIESADYKGEKKHFVCLDFKVKIKDDSQVPVLDGREANDFVWMSPSDILNSQEIESVTKEMVKEFFIKKKKSFFSKECKECEDLKKQVEEYKGGWQRANADYKNLQKEIETRKKEWITMSEIEILEEFIPVYNNFKLAFRLQNSDFSPEQKKWADGIGYIMKQFGDVLKNHGIEEIKTVGEIFNPEIHEAMSEEETEGKKDHEILRELETGYLMNGKVIRPAKVVVNKIEENKQ